jgi:hypothetical protein
MDEKSESDCPEGRQHGRHAEAAGCGDGRPQDAAEFT